MNYHGLDCLSPERLDEMVKGVNPTVEETAHLMKCKWCSYLSAYGDTQCIPIKRLLELSFGQEKTSCETKHLKKCPICAWGLRHLKGNSNGTRKTTKTT